VSVKDNTLYTLKKLLYLFSVIKNTSDQSLFRMIHLSARGGQNGDTNLLAHVVEFFGVLQDHRRFFREDHQLSIVA
jgi:hypothetical protein